jgi:arginase family enzyme
LSRGIDVMEVAPNLDVGGVTSMMGAALIMHYFAATKMRLEKRREN